MTDCPFLVLSQRSPNPLAVFKGPTSKGEGGEKGKKVREGKGREGWPPIGESGSTRAYAWINRKMGRPRPSFPIPLLRRHLTLPGHELDTKDMAWYGYKSPFF